MLKVYETSEVPNNQPSWCHCQMPPVVSHFFWWCYCLIKTHQSSHSIHQNLLSFHCVLHTKFRDESTETTYDTVTSFKEFKVCLEQWQLWEKLSCAGLH